MHGDCHLQHCWTVYLHLSPKVGLSHAACLGKVEYRNSGCFCPSHLVQSDLKAEKVIVSTQLSFFLCYGLSHKKGQNCPLASEVASLLKNDCSFPLSLADIQTFKNFCVKGNPELCTWLQLQSNKLSHVASCPISLLKLRMFQHHLLRSFYMMLT